MLSASRSPPRHFAFPSMLPSAAPAGLARTSSASFSTGLMLDMPSTPTHEQQRGLHDVAALHDLLPSPPRADPTAASAPDAAAASTLSPSPHNGRADPVASGGGVAAAAVVPVRARVRQRLVGNVVFCFTNRYTRLIVSLALMTLNFILLYFTGFAFFLTHALTVDTSEADGAEGGDGSGSSSCASFTLSLFLVFIFFRSLCHVLLIGIRVRDSSMWLNQRGQMDVHHKFFHLMQAVLYALSLVFFAVGAVWLTSSQSQHCVPLATPLVAALVVYEGLAVLVPLVAVAALWSLFPLRSLSLWAPYMPLTSEMLVTPDKLGLSLEQIAALPWTAYTDGMWADDDRRCSICLGEPEVGEDVRALPCRHHYHKACIDEWLLKKPTCPLCVTRVDPAGSSRKRLGRVSAMRAKMGQWRASMSRTRQEESASAAARSRQEREDSAQFSSNARSPDRGVGLGLDLEAVEMA